MAKEQRATDKLNLALAGISAASTMARHLLHTEKELAMAYDEIDMRVNDAYAALRDIKKAAETI